MITKADFDKLKSKKVMPSVLAAENLMLAAWDVVEKSALGLSKAALPFGKFQVCWFCICCKRKPKGGRELATRIWLQSKQSLRRTLRIVQHKLLQLLQHLHMEKLAKQRGLSRV